MKFITLLFGALSSTAAAQYSVSSSAFQLLLKSDNATIDGTALGACHAGAAIETLCPLGGRSGSTLFHYVSASNVSNAVDTPGVLVYVLHAGGDLTVPSPMDISTESANGIDVPYFSPSSTTSTTVNFEDSGSMYMLDTTVKVKNWYLCSTSYGYTRITLAWVVGEPQDSSCQRVEVERVFL